MVQNVFPLKYLVAYSKGAPVVYNFRSPWFNRNRGTVLFGNHWHKEVREHRYGISLPRFGVLATSQSARQLFLIYGQVHQVFINGFVERKVQGTRNLEKETQEDILRYFVSDLPSFIVPFRLGDFCT